MCAIAQHSTQTQDGQNGSQRIVTTHEVNVKTRVGTLQYIEQASAAAQADNRD